MKKLIVIAMILTVSACSSLGEVLKGAGDGLKTSSQNKPINCITTGGPVVYSTSCQ